MTEKSNAFVNLIKKSVGLPTGNSSCCGAPAAAEQPKAADSCCGTSPNTAETTDSAAKNGCCGG